MKYDGKIKVEHIRFEKKKIDSVCCSAQPNGLYQVMINQLNFDSTW